MNEVVLSSALVVLLVQVLALAVLLARRLLLAPRACVVTLNATRALPARTSQRLLSALTAARVGVPAACGGAGTCGLCRVTVTAGGGEPSPAELARLSAAELRGGVRLACQVRLRGDLAVQVPDALLDVQRLVCRVRSSRTLSPFIAELVLELPAGARFEFHAGQFVQVTAPSFELQLDAIELTPEHAAVWTQLGVRALTARAEQPTSRAYSLANRPADAGTLVLDVRLALPPPGSDLPPGVVSSYLFGLRPGAALEVAGPYGDFAVQPGERELVFIGGGAGMAPLRALLFDQLERVRTRRKLSFWYGARSLRELFYVDELDALARAHPNFSWTPALSEPLPTDAWQGAVGFIHQVVRDRYQASHPPPGDCEYYLCGPPLMTEAVYAMLGALGVDRSRIFNDDFGG
jgi:Na+-transporting NADH:ubiquinone oxidoreductase subunit F